METRAQLYTAQGSALRSAESPLRGIDDFDDKPSLIIQWKLRFPCVGAADYPFANLLVER